MAKRKPSTDDQARCQEKVSQLEHSLKRALADFDNFRKRVEQERSEMTLVAKVNLLHELLPVLDNFNRAASHLPTELKDNSWATGILAIAKQLKDLVERQGLETIAPNSADLFDPRLHEAVSHEPHDSIELDHIVETIELGYTINDRVLRPAKVKVSAGKSEISP